MKPQILAAITAIGGIILGAVFSVIAYQYKAEKEKRMSLLELLAEMLKMNDILYDLLMPLKHDMVREYFIQYVNFYNRTYQAKITIETIPQNVQMMIRDAFRKDEDLVRIEFSDEDWDSYFASLNKIKGYYPILYASIWKDKKNIQIFREQIKELPDRIGKMKEAFQKDLNEVIELPGDYFEQESSRNLAMIHKIFQAKLYSVAKYAGHFTFRRIRRIIELREKKLEQGYDFSYL